jgi:pilus assembly protein CpaB
MRRPGIIFLFAIVIGALLSALVYGNLKTQRAELEDARRAMELGTVEVLVANEPISIGSRINAEQVRTARWPADLQPDGAITNVAGVVGRITRTGIDRNQPLVTSQLVDEGSGLLPLLIPEGMRGISVKVDDVTGVSGFVTPNSRVDVIVAGNDGGGTGEQKSKLILQNVRVLATGTSVEQKDDKPVEVPTVTLLVTPADAEKLTLASQQNNPVRLALRSYRDEETRSTSAPPACRRARSTGTPSPSRRRWSRPPRATGARPRGARRDPSPTSSRCCSARRSSGRSSIRTDSSGRR